MGVVYNKPKFRELIVYISEMFEGDPGFGDIKLNKILHFSDLLAYNRFGKPITGARYQKLEFGPCAVALVPVRRELIEDGSVRVESHGFRAKTKRTKTIATRPAQQAIFETAELQIVDEFIRLFRDSTADEVSRFSHEFSGWQLAELHEDIPYDTAFVPTKIDASEATKERGLMLAKQYGW